jgi:membrane protein
VRATIAERQGRSFARRAKPWRILGRLQRMNATRPAGWLRVLRETWNGYQRHNAAWLAAALAYFGVFAVAPLIVVLVEIAGFFFHDHRHVLNVIFRYMQRDFGSGSEAVRQMVWASFNQPRHTLIAQIAGWALFVLGALGLFSSLQFALNTAWDVAPQKNGVAGLLRARALGFGMVLAVALLLLVSVFANAALMAASAYLVHAFAALATLAKIADFLLSLAIIWLLFGLLMQYLPDCRIEWRDVWLGAGLTAFLFTVGQFLLGWYLGRAGVSSAYGAFGSLAVFLLWANYSAQIFLFGAEFTHVCAKQNGALQGPMAKST